MREKDFKKIKTNSGAAMLISVVSFLFISLAIISGLVSPSVREFRNANTAFNSKKAYFLSESGVEDAMYRLLNALTIDDNEVLTLGDDSTTTTIANLVDGGKDINSLGDVSNHQRNSNVVLSLGVGTAFSFGVQSGDGGLVMDNNAGVNGDVYSNGNISGDSGAFITGSAVSAGAGGLIDNIDVGTTGTDEAWANTVTDANITGPLYCQSGSGNNKSCDTSRADPLPQNYLVSTENIDSWKIDAEAGGTITGNYDVSDSDTLGPKKITGNLTFSNNATLTLTGPVWVTGTITTGNNSIVQVDISHGSNSEVLMSDGDITLSNNTDFQGSGTSGSYVLLLTTSSSDNAINVSSDAGAVILNAQSGKINFASNSGANQATAETLYLANNTVINYESGLVNTHFTSGPSGGYFIDTWQETE